MNDTTQTPRVLVNEHCQCGENPLWDDRRKCLYWTDIPAGKLFRWDAATGTHRQIYAGEPVGGFTLQEDGALLLFRVNTIALLDGDGAVRVMKEAIDPEMDRFNDVIADPEGRVFAGTMGKDGRGGLYRVERDLSVTRLFQGTNCANGMGFTPDLRQFYWTDTTGGRIYRFAYDRATGELADRQVAVEVPRAQGFLDGLSVDAEGRLWSARWGGSAAYCYSPAGVELKKIAFPVEKVSSVTFGGEGLGQMFFTTAGGEAGAGETALAGAVFSLAGGATGRLPFRSRIGVR